mgnify:CR=1 FL=1
MATSPLTFLCVSCYFKGSDFLTACKEAGNTVYLVTEKSLEDEPWPRDHIDDVFYLESDKYENPMKQLIDGLSFVMRSRKIDRIVALDDFDVEKAAHLREYFRIPGMGESTSRFFRDKLAMRMKAKEAGIPVPEFTPIFNDEEINQFADAVPGPWLIKPRSEASATGIRKVHDKQQLWDAIHELGDKRHQYLLEHFTPGDVYHVDSISYNGDQLFSRVSKYLDTPMEVAHAGGVFRTQTVEFGGYDDDTLQKINSKLMKAFQMQSSASHSEFIKVHETGQFVFLETASRVGGAHIAELVEASSYINLWKEWAKLETAIAKHEIYALPAVWQQHAGLIISLTKQEHPDASGFQDPEVIWKMDKKYHIGMVLQHPSQERVLELMESYTQRIFEDFHTSAPLPDKPSA